MVEPIEMPFGLWTLVGRRKQVLGYIGCTWRIRCGIVSNYFDHLYVVRVTCWLWQRMTLLEWSLRVTKVPNVLQTSDVATSLWRDWIFR